MNEWTNEAKYQTYFEEEKKNHEGNILMYAPISELGDFHDDQNDYRSVTHESWKKSGNNNNHVNMNRCVLTNGTNAINGNSSSIAI